jgi:hypothetical protein
MVFNATFNNISVIAWRLVLLVEETGVPRENHRPVASHWQPSLHTCNVVSSTPRHEWDLNLQLEFICETTISCYNVNIYKVRPNGFIGFLIVYMRFTEPFPSFVPNTYKLYNLRHCINIVFILQKNHIN